jgi:predicted CxxxxCH...CXXCH cytochrome family protein
MLPYRTPATVLTGQYETVSFPLTEASYDPATKGCATMACHYQASALGAPPLQWGGLMFLPEQGCNACH